MNISTINHTRTSIEQFVYSRLIDMGVDAAAITPATKIIDLGLDSLDVVELSQSVKKNLMIPVSPRDFEKAATIDEAVTLIAQKAGIE